MAGILHLLFQAIFTDFSASVKISLNAIFHFFIVFYAFMAIRVGIIGSLFQIARTILLLLITFNLSFNFDEFKNWIYTFVMEFPLQIAAFFVNSTLSSVIPGFQSPESLNTSQLFSKLSNILIIRAKASGSSTLSVLPSFEAMYLYAIVGLIFVLYMMFWLIQFNFLIQASVYMVIGVPVLLLASFRQTQSIFVEWIRAIATLMLYPVFASIVIFVILNIILPLTPDVENILNDSQITLSATGTLICALVFGIYAMKNIPNMAAVLTRGHMTAGNPLQFAKQAAIDLTQLSAKGALAPFRLGSHIGKATDTSGFNKSTGEKEDGSGSSGPPGTKLVGENKNNQDSVQNMPAAAGQISGSSQSQKALPASTHNYQSLTAVTPSASGHPKSLSTGSTQGNSESGQIIEMKPESSTTVGNDTPVGHQPAQQSGQYLSDLSRSAEDAQRPAESSQTFSTREGDLTQTDHSQSPSGQDVGPQGVVGGDAAIYQANAQSQNINQTNSDSFKSQANIETSSSVQSQSSSQNNNAQKIEQSRPQTFRSQTSGQPGPKAQVSHSTHTQTPGPPSEKQTLTQTVKSEPSSTLSSAASSGLPKVTPDRQPPPQTNLTARRNRHEPKTDLKN